MSNKLEQIKTLPLRSSAKKIHQTDSRQLKALLHEWLHETFQEQEIETHEIKNAIVLELPNDELGAIAIEIKAVVKALDYDVLFESQLHQEHLQEQADKVKEKERLKKLNIENKG